jgi:hypothetical protein
MGKFNDELVKAAVLLWGGLLLRDDRVRALIAPQS